MRSAPNNESRGTATPSLDSSAPPAKPDWRWLIVILPVALAVVMIYLSSTGQTSPFVPGPTLTPSVTPDPCAPAVVAPEVETVDALMREFYDASSLASQTPLDQLVVVIPSMQEIRRRAEAQKASTCLAYLKSLEVAHMNAVINTMMAFMGKANAETLVKGVAQSRLLNEAYRKEKARLLGLPYTPPQIPPTATANPSAAETPAAGTPTATPT